MSQVSITKILHEVSSWQDFKTHLQPLPKNQKGDCFEALVKYYLQLHPNYATKLKEVWYLNEVPPRVRRHLNLPGPDEGIDLAAASWWQAIAPEATELARW